MHHGLKKYFLIPDGIGTFHLYNPDGTPNCGNFISGAISHKIDINPGELPSISIEYPLCVVKDEDQMNDIINEGQLNYGTKTKTTL